MQVDYLHEKNVIRTVLAQGKIDDLVFTKKVKKLLAKHKHTEFETAGIILH